MKRSEIPRDSGAVVGCYSVHPSTLMSDTSTAARPDLSALSREVRVDIVVAVAQGARWNERGELWLDGLLPVYIDGSGEVRATTLLPRYLSDPAATWRLMERHVARWETGEFDDETQHRCWWRSGDGLTLTPGPWCSSLGESVCAAVLTQAGIDWLTLEPVA